MGSFSAGAGLIEGLIGGKASKIGPDLLRLGDTGKAAYDYGGGLTTEGLNDLLGLNDTYNQRLKDPLGAVGRGIFARASGALTDTATQRQNAFGSRIFQQARQSGGTLSPEAQAELNQRNQEQINQDLFKSKNELANEEAGLTLSETSKLFDRMEGIGKTILGAGQDERTRGLQALLASLTLRFNRNQAIANTIVSSMKYGGGSTGGTSAAVQPIG